VVLILRAFVNLVSMVSSTNARLSFRAGAISFFCLQPHWYHRTATRKSKVDHRGKGGGGAEGEGEMNALAAP
jgi:hypothetical protein